METKSFGLLVSHSLPSFDLPAEIVINAFHDAGFAEGLCPDQRLPRAAFHKATKNSVVGEDGFLIRKVSMKGGKMAYGLVKEKQDEENPDLDYAVSNVISFNTRTEVINGKTDFRTEGIKESYVEAMRKLGTKEVGAKIREILYISMGITVLGGKVTFIPSQYAQNVDKLRALYLSLQEHDVACDISVIGVDNSPETRNSIVAEFTAQTLDSLSKELDFCLTQRKKFLEGTQKSFRSSSFRQQLLKLRVYSDRIQAYIMIMDMTADEDREITDKLINLEDEIGKNIEIAEAHAGNRTSKMDRARIAVQKLQESEGPTNEGS